VSDISVFPRVVERLRAEIATKDATIARLRGALEPFAQVAEHDIGDDEADEDRFTPILGNLNRAPLITVGHFRRARAALEATR